MNDVVNIPYGTTGEAAQIYAMILSVEDAGFVWNVPSMVMQAYQQANHPNYAVPVAEVGATGIYRMAVPSQLLVSGKSYSVVVFRKSSAANPASPADELIQTGAVTISGVSGTANVTVVAD